MLIKRAGLENINSNNSDALVDNYPYDYIIENYTLEDLEYQAQQFTNALINIEKINAK